MYICDPDDSDDPNNSYDPDHPEDTDNPDDSDDPDDPDEPDDHDDPKDTDDPDDYDDPDDPDILLLPLLLLLLSSFFSFCRSVLLEFFRSFFFGASVMLSVALRLCDCDCCANVALGRVKTKKTCLSAN